MKMRLPILARVCFCNGVMGPGKSFSTVFIRWTCSLLLQMLNNNAVILQMGSASAENRTVPGAPFFSFFCEMMDSCIFSGRNNKAYLYLEKLIKLSDNIPLSSLVKG